MYEEMVQTQDWGGDILGLVDEDTYLKDVATSLEEQEVNVTYDNPNSNLVNPVRDILNKKEPKKETKVYAPKPAKKRVKKPIAAAEATSPVTTGKQ